MKKIALIICMMFLFTACGGADNEADTKLICKMVTEIENQTYSSIVEIRYNKEDNQIEKGTFKTEYKNSEGLDRSSAELQNIRNRQAKLSGINTGVKVTLDTTESGFSLVEKWDYSKVNIDTAIQMDSLQKSFIENGRYSVEKIKDYYAKQGFTCKEEKIK
ncbi:hypothetical protein [Thomasclavelia sp.]